MVTSNTQALLQMPSVDSNNIPPIWSTEYTGLPCFRGLHALHDVWRPFRILVVEDHLPRTANPARLSTTTCPCLYRSRYFTFVLVFRSVRSMAKCAQPTCNRPWSCCGTSRHLQHAAYLHFEYAAAQVVRVAFGVVPSVTQCTVHVSTVLYSVQYTTHTILYIMQYTTADLY